MGIAYRCRADARCTFIVWDGDVTPEQWKDQVDRITADPGFPPGPLILADLSTAGGVPQVTTDVVEEMAHRSREHAANLGKMRWAIVPNEAWDKARYFEMELEGSGIPTMVFNDTSVACTWLGLDTNDARTTLKDLRQELRNRR